MGGCEYPRLFPKTSATRGRPHRGMITRWVMDKLAPVRPITSRSQQFVFLCLRIVEHLNDWQLLTVLCGYLVGTGLSLNRGKERHAIPSRYDCPIDGLIPDTWGTGLCGEHSSSLLVAFQGTGKNHIAAECSC